MKNSMGNYMIRKTTALLMALICLGMTACGEKEVNIDVKSLGSDLRSGIAYADDLGEIDLDIAGMLMNLSGINIVNSSIYVGAGATAEEIIVLECASEEDAAKAKSMMESRVSEQKTVFADYAPAEAVKLDSAYINVAGKYAIMCVSSDKQKATEIVEKAINAK